MDLEQFYKENYRIVYGYLFGLCGDRAWAEDLTSETFLKAIIKIDSFDGRVRPSTWLCAIGRNLYLNEKKRRKRHVSIDEARLAEDVRMEEMMEDKLLSERITQISREMKEPYRQIFAMRMTGLSFREIGEALGKSETYARVTFFRAKNEILDRLEGPK